MINQQPCSCSFTFHAFNLTATLLVNRVFLFLVENIGFEPGAKRATCGMTPVFKTYFSLSIFQSCPWILPINKAFILFSGGEYRIRTDDPLLAKQVL